MASLRNTPETGAANKADQKNAPKRGVKNPFIYAGTIVILVITIVAFIFIPSMGGVSSSGSKLSFGTWDGKPISYESGSYFANQVAQINDYLRQQGMSEENFQLYAYQVWNLAFQSAAVRTAILDTVKSSGFKVTEAGIDETIAADANFQENGVFSIEKYNALPKSEQLSLRKTTEEDLYIRRYYEDMYSSAPSTAEIAFVASMIKPQRTISYASLALNEYPKENIVAWGKENADLFKSLKVSRVTLTSSESDAKKVLQQVTENKLSFEDAAKSHSQDSYADKGGDAGSVFYYSFEGGFLNASDAKEVAALAKGEISKVYKVADKAWAFFRIDEALSDPDFGSETTLGEIEAYLFEKERGTLESWAIAKANNLLGSAATDGFAKSVKKAGLQVGEAGPFILNLGNPTFYAYNQQIPLLQTPFSSQDFVIQSAEKDEGFMNELFTRKKGELSRPLVVGDSVVVFQVTNDADGSDDESSMVQYMYPYFYQGSLDGNARAAFLKSPKFKDDFTATFFKVFQTSSNTGSQASQEPSSTTGTEAAPATN
jgi:parvulin-like peptidyl-prolyl isomerase